MSIAERIPTLDDAALSRLRLNCLRLEATPGRQQREAAELVVLIEAEVAEREARKPPKKLTKAALAKKVAAEAKAAALAAEDAAHA
jgi:hypothetical protein